MVAFLLGILIYINIKPSYVNDEKVIERYILAEEREPRIHGDRGDKTHAITQSGRIIMENLVM
ncbi:hypothetical protein O163_02640 [Caldanaerobacter subterraneus subsp. yonseiensis KB-1]|uniref:Uncharacterized protein n=1 Tax=Caldanaerobacter subterraneus subsp. yonseiensis KB-1 TaxID=1388761 RepID=U5CJ27_CALSX|nr:hypothetical protein O163_02640 [Caldanaerobacter subterraneus subsp. yonseiensis KB-1]